jgi:predicted dehydrogenase
MARKRYQIGVIGCGVIWDGGHWNGLKTIPDATQVRYVYDLNAELTRKAASATGAKPLVDPNEMFDDPEVDIISVCTPPGVRVRYVEQACAAGKHLMVEKPMARSLEDALRIVAAVRKSGVKCFVPFARAVGADFRKVVEIIESGELGDPLVFVHSNLGTPYFWVALDHWMHDMEKSGGPIFDFSIHFIEMARACMRSEAREVLYAGAAPTGRVKSDDHATLIVFYQSGGIGEFTKSWAFPPGVKVGQNATHVVCRNGVIVLGAKTEIHTPEGSREVPPCDPPANGRAESYLNLIAAIENDTPLYASELNGLRTNEILDAALRSRATGRKESVVIHP